MTSSTQVWKTVDKELFIGLSIRTIEAATNRKPGRLVIEFKYPGYLKCCTDQVNELIGKLMSQALGGYITIKRLSLTWFEDIESEVQE